MEHSLRRVAAPLPSPRAGSKGLQCPVHPSSTREGAMRDSGRTGTRRSRRRQAPRDAAQGPPRWDLPQQCRKPKGGYAHRLCQHARLWQKSDTDYRTSDWPSRNGHCYRSNALTFNDFNRYCNVLHPLWNGALRAQCGHSQGLCAPDTVVSLTLV